jgi:hypothetical protein
MEGESKKIIIKTTEQKNDDYDDMLLMANLSKTYTPNKSINFFNNEENDTERVEINKLEDINNEEFENISLEDEDEDGLSHQHRRLLKKESRPQYIQKFKNTVKKLLDLYSNNASTGDDFIDIIFDELFIKAKEYEEVQREMREKNPDDNNDVNDNNELELLSAELLANHSKLSQFL